MNNQEGQAQSKKFADLGKRVEEALRESEERFKSIYSQSPIAIELYDPEGHLIDVNAACCLDMFGVADVEAVKGFKLFGDPSSAVGLRQPHPQRHPGYAGGWPVDRRLGSSKFRGGGCVCHRYRGGYPGAEPGEALRATLHHQGQGDRAGFGHLQEPGGSQRGEHRGGE